MNRQTGISRLEMAIGTTVFAVLLASFLPRFLNVQHEARGARLLQAYGEISSAIRTTHATVLARQSGPDSSPCGNGETAENRLSGASAVCINGTYLPILHGYPSTRMDDGIPGLLALLSFAQGRNNQPTIAAFQQAGLTYESTHGLARIGLREARDPKHCFFEYTESLTPGSAATLGEPVTTGC